MTRLQEAMTLAQEGFAVFPIKPGVKAPPLIKDWPEYATTDRGQINTWWNKWPDANIGIHCKGLLVVDVDVKKDGDASLEYLEEFADFPMTLTTVTPTGGRHLIYQLPEGHAGVQNGVDVLGKGLDIRSTHGYIVAPGSTVDAGDYITDGVSMSMAPDWLVQDCGTFTKREHEPVMNIPDADEQVMSRAEVWLESADRSVQGAGGDETAYKVACGLRDFGLSYAQACDLMRSDAWDNGCGWRAGWLEQKPIASAYRYASNQPGTKVALASDFEVSEPEPQPVRVSRLVSFGDVAEKLRSQSPYLIKNVLYQRSFAQMYGQPGNGKTFLALDMGFHIAAGRQWNGYPTRQCPVIYIAFEGTGGLWKRFAAIQKHYRVQDVPLYLLNGSGMDLRKPEDRKQLGEDIKSLDVRPGLIILDTFARAMAGSGGDENSAQDVGAYLDAIEGLIDAGICVMHLHHPGKDSSKGGRGSSAIFGALDTEFEIANFEIKTTKQRDVELVDPIAFKLEPVNLGLDPDGDPVMSCVVIPSAGPAVVRTMPKGNAKLVWAALCRLSPNGAPVNRADLLGACKLFLPQTRARAAFAESLDQLDARNMLTYDNNIVRRKLDLKGDDDEIHN